jgi:hypothetical protein
MLDAHMSGRRLAQALRDEGHDVRAADEQRDLDGWTDERILALAADEERILFTFDVKDFPVIVRRWAEAGRGHSGCAIVVGIDHSEFGTILRAIARELVARPEQGSWHDYTCFVGRGDV